MKYLRLLFAILLLSVIEPYMAYSQNKKVAILEVVDREGTIGYGVKLMIRSNLASAITATPGYEGYDRVDMDQILGEHNFQRTGMVSEQQIKRLGEMTGAQYILVSEAIILKTNELFVASKILDIESAKILKYANVKVDNNIQSINESSTKLANELMSEIQLSVAQRALSDKVKAKSVAILNVVDRENFMNYEMEFMIRSNFAKAITDTPGYEGYDRSDIDQILSEHNFQRTGMVSDEQIRRVGEMSGAQYVLITEVAKVDHANVFFTTKLLDIETARIEKTASSISGISLSDLQNISVTLARDLLGWKNGENNSGGSVIITDEINAKDLYFAGVRAYEAKNYVDAMKCLKSSFEKNYEGNHLNAYYLGTMYLEGLGVKRDISVAAQYFSKCLQLSNSSRSMRVAVGNCVVNFFIKQAGSLEPPTDFHKLVAILKMCDAATETSVQQAIGAIYKYLADAYPVYNQYYADAFKWLSQAAYGRNANAQYLLSHLYLEGRGVKKDRNKYKYWLQKAADQGYQQAIDEL